MSAFVSPPPPHTHPLLISSDSSPHVSRSSAFIATGRPVSSPSIPSLPSENDLCHQTHELSTPVLLLTPRVIHCRILCLWFRASLIYINNCPTRCNTKQSVYYSASSLYMFRVLTTPIIRSTQNCNYSLRCCAANSLQRGQTWPRWREVTAQKV